MNRPTRAQITQILLDNLRHFYSPPRGAVPRLHQLTDMLASRTDFPRGDTATELEVLAAINDLFRSGVLGWGHCLEKNFSEPPFFHVTALGRDASRRPSRDPSNSEGYMENLRAGGPLDDIVESYIAEAVKAYNSGCFKSAAVMVGAAAERLIVMLRDVLVQRLTQQGRPVPAALTDWRIKTVRDELTSVLNRHQAAMPRQLRESYPMHWPSLSEHLRRVRNDAGHPSSIRPVTPELAHGNLLEFPLFLEIVAQLSQWVPGQSF
jgi:hypothetical protein